MSEAKDFLALDELAPEALSALQRPRFTTEVRHFAARCRTRRVASQSALAGFQELLRPAVIKTLSDAFPAAKLGNARLAPQAVQHNPDLLFRRVLLAGRPSDVLHKSLGRRTRCHRFLSHLVPFRLTMSRKSSLPQDVKSVSVVLTPDKLQWLATRRAARR